MTNIYEEAYKEAERKIKKLSEDFKKDLDKILKECTKNKPQIGEECELVGIEKQVWESTLNRSMVLQAENDKLKTDCRTLGQKLLQVKPELREWLEVNYKEYL